MRVSEGTLTEIKSSTDIVDLVSGYIQLQKRGKTFLGLCPFHEDRTPSFDVDPERQRYRCWSCGQHGDVFQFLIEHEKISFVEAVEMLAERAGIRIENQDDSTTALGRSKKTDLYAVLSWSRELFKRFLHAPQAERARTYLKDRGFTEETIEGFHLGAAPVSPDFLRVMARKNSVSEQHLLEAGLLQESERGGLYEPFRNRVLFPIHDPLGRVIGYGGRVLDDSKPKYRNSPETAIFQKRKNLFGLDVAKKSRDDGLPIALVEGYTDAIMAHQAGFPRVVAGLGTALTEGQARLVRRYSSRICLLYDGDESGRKAVEAGTEVCLRAGLQVLVSWLPAGSDPCDLIRAEGAEGFQNLLLRARDYFDDRLDNAGNLPERERAELAAKLLNKVRCVEDVLIRDAMTRRIAEELKLTESAVRGWLDQRRDGAPARRSRQAPLPARERTSPAEIAGRDLLKEALFFPHLARAVSETLEAEDFPTRPQRLVYEAILRNLAAGSIGSEVGDPETRKPVGPDEIPLLLEEPDARALAHALLADPSISGEEATLRVEANLAYFTKQKTERELAQNRLELHRVLSEEGDDHEKDRVMLEYLDRLRQKAGKSADG